MLKDVTLGQYLPGDTLLHKIDPRMKLILTVIFIVSVFLAQNLWALLTMALLSLALVFISKLSPKVVFKALKPIIFVIIFTAVISVFWKTGEGKPLLSFWKIKIYKEGIIYALLVAVRIIVLVLGTNVLLSYTTSPIALTDGLEQLLSPLKKIKVPVHTFSMIMTIALRFIPTLIEETDKIMSAQRSRGADFSNGSLVKRAKALVPVFIPLFASLIRRADELAVAMECRCYTGDNGRTSMNTLKYKARDILALVFSLALAVGIFFISKYTGGYSF
ncbi:MAG: energy-coupling factor transporter transmembrane protein EcfT [Clostridia bacterium]|nr:energy-coupling factor transporter transmembrane protein EcfT [Clostridia bacterium]